jgi:carbonic anhydrase/acetyltransferase-like protein (isoleucine patch superfamily)
MVIPDGSMVVGSPAKIKKELSEGQRKQLEMSAQFYVQNFRRYKTKLKSKKLFLSTSN